MKISKAIEGFYISRLADGYANVTLHGYKSAIGILANFLGDPELDSVKPENLNSFMQYLHTNYQPVRSSGNKDPLATASFHRYWKALRCFFKWSNEEGYSSRPDLDLKMPKYTNKEIAPFTENEIQKLLKGTDFKKRVYKESQKSYQCARATHLALRDKALIFVLLDTGVRSGECGRIKIRDVNLETGKVAIVPYHVRKTRPRVVFLGKTSRKAVWKYLNTRPNAFKDDRLFVTKDNKPIFQGAMGNILRTIGRNCGVSNVHPHRFRHTFAIQYLRNGGDVFTLQRLLGHSTLEMVRHYLFLADSDTQEAHRKSSPADRWNL